MINLHLSLKMKLSWYYFQKATFAYQSACHECLLQAATLLGERFFLYIPLHHFSALLLLTAAAYFKFPAI